MTLTDWIVDLVLIGLVVVQLRERRLTSVQVLLPVAIVVWAGTTYVRTIPTSGDDLVLIVLLTAVGALIGAGVAAATRVRTRGPVVVVRASAGAAALWVAGMGSRLAFQMYATHGGGAAIGRFTAAHDLTPDVWAPAILLMAAATVLARTGILLARVRTAGRGADTGTADGR